MAIRTIREYGDEILTKRCKEIKEITPRIKELASDMIETMHEAGGVGLAAPQVGILKRMFVIDVTGEDAFVIINRGDGWKTDGLRRVSESSRKKRHCDQSESCSDEGL